MSENPLAEAFETAFSLGSAAASPPLKVIVSPYCEAGKVLVMDPVGTGLVDVATEIAHRGLKIVVCPTEDLAEQFRQQAREAGFNLLDDVD